MSALSALHPASAGRTLPGILAHDLLAPGEVEADVTYLVDTGVKPVTYMPPPEGGETRRTGSYAPYRVAIRNARTIAGLLSLDRHGIRLTRHDTSFADFHDADAVQRVYYPEMARLVQSALGRE